MTGRSPGNGQSAQPPRRLARTAFSLIIAAPVWLALHVAAILPVIVALVERHGTAALDRGPFPASDVALEYRDAAGAWRPLTTAHVGANDAWHASAPAPGAHLGGPQLVVRATVRPSGTAFAGRAGKEVRLDLTGGW